MNQAHDPPGADAHPGILSEGAALRLGELFRAASPEPLEAFAAFATARPFGELVSTGIVDDFVEGFLDGASLDAAALCYELSPEAARLARDLPEVVRSLAGTGRIGEVLLRPDVLRGIALAMGGGDPVPLAAAIDSAFAGAETGGDGGEER